LIEKGAKTFAMRKRINRKRVEVVENATATEANVHALREANKTL